MTLPPTEIPQVGEAANPADRNPLSQQTLPEKIQELVGRLTEVNMQINGIHLDPTYLNESHIDYAALVRERREITARIWTLKNNW